LINFARFGRVAGSRALGPNRAAFTEPDPDEPQEIVAIDTRKPGE
jgi:hypothetical protein